MYYSKPFPGQADQMFKDKFCKWPKLMRTLVFISLLPSTTLIFLVHQQDASLAALESTLAITAAFNLLLLCWGLFLKIRSKRYWYRNYHIGKTMLLAALPLLACGYMFLLNPEIPDMAKQQKAQAVQISIN
ncbi:hypothetical protein [uncultured Photobacterium sp.]|uniref:hypothetical protein n=1 Tax=uncultured Photobacterium sp. TaxID=173973 RepID=UPI00262D1992|nr:hypothetical protein [uncultured Photobacterium sp.]